MEITSDEYRALAELRYRIRHFVSEGDVVAQAAGLEPQQYLLLLAIRGLPADQEATIRTLADRLALKHHSAVELVDRMEKRGLFRRERSTKDRRQVHVFVTPRGEKLLSRLVRHRIAELRVSAPELAHALQAVLAAAREPSPGSRRSARTQEAGNRHKQAPSP